MLKLLKAKANSKQQTVQNPRSAPGLLLQWARLGAPLVDPIGRIILAFYFAKLAPPCRDRKRGSFLGQLYGCFWSIPALAGALGGSARGAHSLSWPAPNVEAEYQWFGARPQKHDRVVKKWKCPAFKLFPPAQCPRQNLSIF